MRIHVSILALCLSSALCATETETLKRAAALNDKAALLADQERYLEAEAGYRAAIRLIEREYGAEAPALAQPLNNLAIVYRRLGRLRDAERGYMRSLAIREEAGDRAAASLVRINLARLYLQQGRRGEASDMLEKAGMEGPTLAAGLHIRAALLLRSRRYGQAADLAAQARRAWQERGLAVEAAQAQAMRGEALRLAGRPEEAQVELAMALEELRAALGQSHPEVGRVLVAYGQTLRSSGEGRRGRKLRKQGRAILAAAPDRVAREHIVDVRAGYTRSR